MYALTVTKIQDRIGVMRTLRNHFKLTLNTVDWMTKTVPFNAHRPDAENPPFVFCEWEKDELLKELCRYADVFVSVEPDETSEPNGMTSSVPLIEDIASARQIVDIVLKYATLESIGDYGDATDEVARVIEKIRKSSIPTAS